jgi:hypothetical protein
MTGTVGIGNLTISSRSRDGAPGTGATYGRGTIASNGNITLGGNTSVNGDALPGPGKTVTVSGNATITGSRTPLSVALDYPMPSAGSAATSNSNGQIPSAYINDRDLTVEGSNALTLPGGTYYVDDIYVKSGATLNFSGRPPCT